MNLAFAHEPGTAISCLSIPIILHKEGAPGIPETELKCGFKIGGGIDQDYRKSPQVTFFVLFSLSHFLQTNIITSCNNSFSRVIQTMASM